MRTRFLALLLSTSLSACGSSASNQTAANDGGLPDISRKGDEQRQAGRPQQGTAAAQGIDCASVTAQPPGGMDMIGVTIGMPADQAFARIACVSPDLRVEFVTGGGFDVPPPPNGGQMRTGIEARADNERISATLIGMPGQERVAYISRRVRYTGQQASVEATMRIFQNKYGRMATAYTGTDGIMFVTVRAPDGRLLLEPSDRENFIRCLPTPFAPGAMSDCGAGLRVMLLPAGQNTPLVGQMTEAMSDGAAVARMIEEYRAAASGAQRPQ